VLRFKRNVSSRAFDGLKLYSHVWILFIFHENTNTKKMLRAHADPRKYEFPSKVYAPRANGAKVGVFATRTPHRPNPVGLSVARIVEVDPARRTITVASHDLVDGTPILDVKPYLPAFDSLPQAQVPRWVADQRNATPRPVTFSASAESFLETETCRRVLLKSAVFTGGAGEWREAARQVLSVDVSRPPAVDVTGAATGEQAPRRGKGRTRSSLAGEYTLNFAGLRAHYRVLPLVEDADANDQGRNKETENQAKRSGAWQTVHPHLQWQPVPAAPTPPLPTFPGNDADAAVPVGDAWARRGRTVVDSIVAAPDPGGHRTPFDATLLR
jgi:tRNA-Thr(GGU) m(6)t(6)A37 methyltransferase TsaA